MGVGDDQLHPTQSSSPQRAQERRPEGAVLAIADVQAEDFPAAIGGDPVAMTTARLTTRPSTLALRSVASTNRDGKAVGDSERERNAATSASSSAQIRLTADLEMPASTPRALTRSSTLRVEVPCTSASITTASSARSMRRPGSSSAGKHEPSRSFGMRSSTSPALVDSSRVRVPLRWVVRVSVRS
jgi:hypothetical protein